MSEDGFTRDGIAVVPQMNHTDLGSDMARWTGLTMADKRKELTSKPMPEMEITQEMRQKKHSTTGKQQMITACSFMAWPKIKTEKNTIWLKLLGTNNKYKGTWYASKAFVKYKTMNILVHKDALPKEIAKKLGFKIRHNHLLKNLVIF